MTPRREFSAATRRAAWERANGCCEGLVRVDTGIPDNLTAPYDYLPALERCNAPLFLGNFHYDHIDPDWFSKDSEINNCQLLCTRCHLEKTKRDVKNIAKSKRLQDKRIKARKPKGRPMPGTKRSGLRKRMDGTVERR